MPRVLHLLSQQPGRTGSGVTLASLVRHAAESGWEQCVVVGLPAGLGSFRWGSVFAAVENIWRELGAC